MIESRPIDQVDSLLTKKNQQIKQKLNEETVIFSILVRPYLYRFLVNNSLESKSQFLFTVHQRAQFTGMNTGRKALLLSLIKGEENTGRLKEKMLAGDMNGTEVGLLGEAL